MKRVHIYKGTKRSIVLHVLQGVYTIEQAARVVRVQPATIKRWVKQLGQEVRATYCNE